MTPDEVLEYAREHGPEAGYGMTLLLGPDNIEGGWAAYIDLLGRFGGGE